MSDMASRSEQARPLLEVAGLTKSFLGQRALDSVDFTLRAGEIHALLGENGAGKSTLIKAVTGVVQRDAGTVRLDGVEIMPRSSEEAVKAGIATVYQEVNLLPNLTVAENLFLGRQPTRFGLVRDGVMRRDAAALLRGFGLAIDVGAPLGDYSVAVQHLVAIARAVDMSARVLILDEPTASLDAHEVDILFGIMRQLAGRGIGILFVTHFLDQVYAISDRITVLRNGRLVGERETSALPRLDLVHMMLGRELSEVTADREHRPIDDAKPPYARFQDVRQAALSWRRSISPCGAGRWWRSPACSARAGPRRRGMVFGAERADTGTVEVDGETSASARRARPSASASAIARKSARPRASSPNFPCARTSCWRFRPGAAG